MRRLIAGNWKMNGLRAEATALASACTLAVVCLVLPSFTEGAPGPEFTSGQLAFAAVASLALYGLFVWIQTIRHRVYFLPEETAGPDDHAPPPSDREAFTSLGLLLVSLVAVVGLAKALSPTLEDVVDRAGAPKAVVGIMIAALVLLPEGLAAYRAARLDRLQTSMNLVLGSALATIGLTIPAVAIAAIALGQPLSLGLGAKEQILLALTLLVSVMTLGTGRTTVMQGTIHLVVLASFLFLAVVP